MGVVTENEAKIMEMYHEMKSCFQISKAIGSSSASVMRFLKKKGLCTDLHQRRREKIVVLFNLGYKHGEISAKLGCSGPTVTRAIRAAYPNGHERLYATDTQIEFEANEAGFDFRPHNLRFKQA